MNEHRHLVAATLMLAPMLALMLAPTATATHCPPIGPGSPSEGFAEVKPTGDGFKVGWNLEDYLGFKGASGGTEFVPECIEEFLVEFIKDTIG